MAFIPINFKKSFVPVNIGGNSEKKTGFSFRDFSSQISLPFSGTSQTTPAFLRKPKEEAVFKAKVGEGLTPEQKRYYEYPVGPKPAPFIGPQEQPFIGPPTKQQADLEPKRFVRVKDRPEVYDTQNYYSHVTDEKELMKLTGAKNVVDAFRQVGIVDYLPGEVLSKSGDFKLTEPELKTMRQTPQADISHIKRESFVPVQIRRQNLPSLDFFDKVNDLIKRPQQLVPFLASADDSIKIGKLLISADKLKKNTATEEDILLLKEYIDQANTDKSFGYQVLNVVSMVPSFAGELYFTGGVATAGRTAVIKSGKEVLKSLLTKGGKEMLEKRATKFGLKIVGEVAGRTIQAPVAGATRIVANTLEKQLQETLTKGEEKEDLTRSLAKAVGEQWVETVSEFSGGLLTSLSNPVKNKMLKVAFFSAFEKINKGASSGDLAKIVKRMGWNGVFGEMFEERIGDVGHGLLNEIGLSDQDFSIPSAEQLAVEFTAFSVPGMGIALVDKFDSELKYIKGIQPGLTIKDVSEPTTQIKEAELLKPKPSVVQFQTKADRSVITKQGEYTNSFWMLKKNFVPAKLKERMMPITKEGPDASVIWKKAKEGNLAPTTDIVGYFEDIDKTNYILKNAKGENIGVSKIYYDYLKRNINDFNLKATEPTKPLIVYSGKKEAGLLMPIYMKDVSSIKFLKTKAQEMKVATSKIEPLTQQARKYKTADEFVKAQGKPFYHGTQAKFDKFDVTKLGEFTGAKDTKLGFHFTQNKNIANSFGKYVKEVYLSIKKPFDLWGDFVGNSKKYRELYNIIEGKKKGIDFAEFSLILEDGLAFNSAEFKAELLAPNVIKNMKKAGYDGLKLPHTAEDILQTASEGITNVKGSEVIPFNVSQIKTKSQLTDIWKKAKTVKQTEEEISLIQDEVREKVIYGLEKVKKGGFETPLENFSEADEILKKIYSSKETKADIDRGLELIRLSKKPTVKEVVKEPITKEFKQITTKSEEALAKEYEHQKDIWIGNKDTKSFKAQIEKRLLQKNIKNAIGAKKFRKEAKDMDRAIQISIDIKRDPGAVDKYYDKLTTEQKNTVDLAQKLPNKIKVVANKIRESYDNIGIEALDAGVIKNILDNYANRIWDLDKKKTNIFSRFNTTTRHAKQRKYATILEGWANGMELKVEGATNNLEILKQEIERTISDKKFVDTLKKIKTVDGEPLLSIRQLDGYAKIDHPNFKIWRVSGLDAEDARVFKSAKNFFITDDGIVMEHKELYAPQSIAKNLNNILGQSKLKDVPGIHTLTKYNAIIKAWILQSSFFHHLAFMRSYWLGTSHKKWKELSPRRAYREGLKAMEEQDPLIKLGVRNGLTLGVKQDWSEELLREKTIIGKWLDKTKATKKVKDEINRLRQVQADFLFGELGSGLKAKSFLIEYRNQVKKYPNEDVNVISKRVAELINDDFGGLHLQRMGRNPTGQHIFRLMALAPDWTESNVNTMVKMFSKGDKAKRNFYRKFWAGVLTKGTILTIMSNFILAGGDPEKFWENYKIAWKQGNLKWMAVDITPIYKALGGKSDEHKYFWPIGHFKDVFKFVSHPIRSAKHKGSVLFSFFFEAITGTDWAGKRFTKLSELLGVDDKGVYVTTREGKYKKGDPKGGKLAGQTVVWDFVGGKPIDYKQLPSFILSQIKGSQPVQVQNLLSWTAGEMDGFDAIMNSMGLGVSSSYNLTEETEKKDKGPRDYDKYFKDTKVKSRNYDKYFK